MMAPNPAFQHHWFPSRDGFGDVVGPVDPDDGLAPMLGQMTLAEARKRFGPVIQHSNPLAVTIPREDP
jgi:hypothetical protein